MNFPINGAFCAEDSIIINRLNNLVSILHHKNDALTTELKAEAAKQSGRLPKFFTEVFRAAFPGDGDAVMYARKRIDDLEAENKRLQANMPKSAIRLERENSILRAALEEINGLQLGNYAHDDFHMAVEIAQNALKSLEE